jgi:hypothetical protein
MLSPEGYRRLRWKFFRVHFQYIMASERPCPYDYILLIGGPMAIAEWARRHWELTLSFIWDGMRDDRGRVASSPSPAMSSPAGGGAG